MVTRSLSRGTNSFLSWLTSHTDARGSSSPLYESHRLGGDPLAPTGKSEPFRSGAPQRHLLDLKPHSSRHSLAHGLPVRSHPRSSHTTTASTLTGCHPRSRSRLTTELTAPCCRLQRRPGRRLGTGYLCPPGPRRQAAHPLWREPVRPRRCAPPSRPFPRASAAKDQRALRCEPVRVQAQAYPQSRFLATHQAHSAVAQLLLPPTLFYCLRAARMFSACRRSARSVIFKFSGEPSTTFTLPPSLLRARSHRWRQ